MHRRIWAFPGYMPLCRFTHDPAQIQMSRLMTKPTKWPERPAKTQISLGIRPVWSAFAVRMKKAWSLATHWAQSEDSDQTGRWCPGWPESSLGAQAILLVLPWGGSNACAWRADSSPWFKYTRVILLCLFVDRADSVEKGFRLRITSTGLIWCSLARYCGAIHQVGWKDVLQAIYISWPYYTWK